MNFKLYQKKIKKIFLIFLGLASTVTGIIGIVVPLLPTTPFLLLGAYCFLKSSTKLYNWLINHKIFGKYIYNYLKYKSITFTGKITSIVLLWLTLGISMFLLKNLHVTIFLLLIGLSVSIHLIKLKIYNPKLCLSKNDEII